MEYTVFLFDVDGVLVHPRGYKEALRATVGYFASHIHPRHFPLDDEVIAQFEALGVTNEWESAPFCLAALLHHYAQANHTTFADWASLLSAWREHIHQAEVDFAAIMAQALGNGWQGRASHRFLEYFSAQSAPAWHPWWEHLLADVYTLATPTTAIFQAHTLGYEKFIATYGHAPLVSGESYLLAHDTPLLSSHHHAQLLAWQTAPQHGFSIFTARPSLPPRASQADALGYAPEADLAAELLMLANTPLIGSGRLQWLGTVLGTVGADYVKPHPLHALAAIGAALTNNEADALRAAAHLLEHGELLPLWADLVGANLHVVVFEDSSGGIKATRTASEILTQHGIHATYQAVGIAPEPSKRAALEAHGAIVVADINQGLDWIWQA